VDKAAEHRRADHEPQRAAAAGNDRGGTGAVRRGEVRPEKPDRGHADRAGRKGEDFREDHATRVRDSHDRFGDPVPVAHRLVDGCPPGLARKNNGCRPPGLERKERLAFFDRPEWWGLRGLEGDRYGYYDGSLLRFGSDDSVLGYLPLLGGALAPGNVWPSFYEPVTLPRYAHDYYGLGPNDSYRYYDDTLYNIDPSTMAITSVAALLTGDDIDIGEPLPVGYDVYNVPASYRDRYVDGPDAFYRYSDGYVYQVDPETRLVSAAIELLT
jgi:hypothetical protein